jgi:phosphopentomutase
METHKDRRRVFLVILDGVGIGALPDAAAYGDEGANSLLHCSQKVGGLPLPCLDRLGLGRIAERKGSIREPSPAAHFGVMQEASPGKDTLTGHWELMGLILSEPFPTFPQGLPRAILDAFEEKTGWAPLGGHPASGTEIIEALGREHLASGRPIVYTSADSVLQIAAHLDRFSLEALYRMCQDAREIVDPHGIARVIARPFTGRPGRFQRTADRKDFALPPPGPTLLDVLDDHNIPVLGIGKIRNIFAGRGVHQSLPAADNSQGIRSLEEALDQHPEGLVFINLNDFDTEYGHRRDVQGYAAALRALDDALPHLLDRMRKRDILMLTADHGCDPTHRGSDHTREFVPLLVHTKDCREGSPLGVRTSFADVAATVAEAFSVPWKCSGESFFRCLQTV